MICFVLYCPVSALLFLAVTCSGSSLILGKVIIKAHYPIKAHFYKTVRNHKGELWVFYKISKNWGDLRNERKIESFAAKILTEPCYMKKLPNLLYLFQNGHNRHFYLTHNPCFDAI